MNILITEKEFQEYTKLKQEKKELKEWLEEEISRFKEEI